MAEESEFQQAEFERAQAGDSIAFENLFQQYRVLLHVVTDRYYVSGMEQDDLEQEARIVMIRLLKRFDPEKGMKFGTFFVNVFRDRVIDLIRHESAQKRQPAEPLKTLDSELLQHNFQLRDFNCLPPDDIIASRELLWEAIRRSSYTERLVLQSLVDGRNPEDLMIRHSLSQAQIKRAATRARRRLLDLMTA